MNEYSQIVGQWFTHTCSLEEVRPALERFAARYSPGQGPDYIWVDNYAVCGTLLKKIFPTIKIVLEDSAHLVRRYMRTLTPGQALNQDFMAALSMAFFTLHAPDVREQKVLYCGEGNARKKLMPYLLLTSKTCAGNSRCARIRIEAGQKERCIRLMEEELLPDVESDEEDEDAAMAAHTLATHFTGRPPQPSSGVRQQRSGSGSGSGGGSQAAEARAKAGFMLAASICHVCLLKLCPRTPSHKGRQCCLNRPGQRLLADDVQLLMDFQATPVQNAQGTRGESSPTQVGISSPVNLCSSSSTSPASASSSGSRGGCQHMWTMPGQL
ncbi:g4033 [Coccomyxa elongata]